MRIGGVEFTHYATFYGIPCYFGIATNTLVGRNAFWELVLRPTVRFAQFVEWICQVIDPFHEPEFPVKIGPQIQSKCADAMLAEREK